MMCGPRNEAETVKRQVPRQRELRRQSLILKRFLQNVHGEEFQEKREFRERNHVQHTFSWVQRCNQNWENCSMQLQEAHPVSGNQLRTPNVPLLNVLLVGFSRPFFIVDVHGTNVEWAAVGRGMFSPRHTLRPDSLDWQVVVVSPCELDELEEDIRGHLPNVPFAQFLPSILSGVVDGPPMTDVTVEAALALAFTFSFTLAFPVCIWFGQVAKLRDAGAEWRMSCAFRTGKYGKIMWMSESVKSLSGVVSKWPCKNSKDRWDMRTECDKNLEPCVCVHTHEDVRMCAEKCACDGLVCVHSPVVHTVVATTCVRTPWKSDEKNSVEKKNINIHHSMTILTKHMLHFVVWVRWVYVQNPLKFSDFIFPRPSWSFLLVLVPSVGFSSIEACVLKTNLPNL